jgi:hypothetical protein
VVLALMATGLPRLTCCQPLAVSPLKVARASRLPVLDHRLPTWLLVLAVPL